MAGMTRALAVVLLAAVLVTPAPGALAQQAAAPARATPPADTWVLTRMREGDSLLATAPFSNGITVVARCSNDVFSLILVGLPEPVDGSGSSRDLTVKVDEVVGRGGWIVASSEPTAAFSRLPAPMARLLSKGGQLQVIIPAPPGGRRTRYVMDLTQSVSAVQEVLTHCHRPLVDPRDDELFGDGNGLPSGVIWVRTPSPEFPHATVHGGAAGGTVTLSCAATADGRLRDCQVENEFPEGFGFGLAARRGVGSARVGLNDDARAAGRRLDEGRIVFSVSFITPS
jgi:hypothetical protein